MISTQGNILEVKDIKASYGPFNALFGVSFVVPAGSTVALLGANGAGKSTVARVISGLVHANSGSVEFAGIDVTRWSAWKIARAGMSHAPEGRAVFGSLTVHENLALSFRQSVGAPLMKTATERAYQAFPRLRERSDQLAETLSGGEQRMLALARVLAVPPRLIVVDELSLGLAPVMVDEVFTALRTMKEHGTSILVVEQHVNRALDLADSVVVLSKGIVTHQGPVCELGDKLEQLIPKLNN